MRFAGVLLVLIACPHPDARAAEEWRASLAGIQSMAAEGRLAEARKALLDEVKDAERAGRGERLAATLNNLGSATQDMGFCGEAASAYRRSLAIWERIGQPRAAIRTAANLTGLLLMCQDVREARRVGERNVLPHIPALQDDDPDAALLLVVAAHLHRERKQYAAAEPLLRRALRLRGPDASILNALALVRACVGDYEGAIADTQRALQLLERPGGPAHPHAVRLLGNLGSFYASAYNLTKAEEFYQKALTAAETTHGPGSFQAAEILANYAALLRTANRRAEAAETARRARAIYEQATRDNRRYTVDVDELQASRR
ncbi:MAG TPA: tetratricopeptide repeat protein [Bryobacteraceae bacterium]|nr:tetratricopeptide repeat protein [Bryobacteraceae bacterium]